MEEILISPTVTADFLLLSREIRPEGAASPPACGANPAQMGLEPDTAAAAAAAAATTTVAAAAVFPAFTNVSVSSHQQR